MAIILKFIGGVRTVTGSMHLLTAGRSKVLIDCGLFQGRREEFYRTNTYFPFEPSALNAVILSHAHIDHCGNFPTLVMHGFRSHAYVTPVSKSLCWYMLPDSGYVQEEDVKYINKIERRRGIPKREALYTREDAERSLKYLKKLHYHRRHSIAPDLDLTFFDSGHILGSSIPVIDIQTPRGHVRIAYAVDLGRPDLPYLHNPEIPQKIDYLVIESTYGGRKRPTINAAETELMKAVNKTVKRGGKIIIPSFALERTQEILYFLARLFKYKKIKNIPIYVDSPLAVHITDVFRTSWDVMGAATKEVFKNGEDLFDNSNINYIFDVNQSKRLNSHKGPLIIISASGMCESGRILHHLKNNVENPRNTVLIVGYMAENTLGRKIVERQPIVNIFGRPYRLKAEVITLDAFSSHADHPYLFKYIKECMSSVKKVFIVHGEYKQADKLRQAVKSLDVNVSIPEKDEEVYIAAPSKG